MLLTDGSPNNDRSLQVYESAILAVSNTEMIPLHAKLRLALEEISEDVLDVLLDHGSPADPMAMTRRTVGVSDVVVNTLRPFCFRIAATFIRVSSSPGSLKSRGLRHSVPDRPNAQGTGKVLRCAANYRPAA